MTLNNGPPAKPDETDFIMKIALNNLPKGRTLLSESNKNSWEPCENGVFKLDETYRTIQQTDLLHELKLDSELVPLTELDVKKGRQFGKVDDSKRPNNFINSDKKTSNKKNRIE